MSRWPVRASKRSLFSFHEAHSTLKSMVPKVDLRGIKGERAWRECKEKKELEDQRTMQHSLLANTIFAAIIEFFKDYVRPAKAWVEPGKLLVDPSKTSRSTGRGRACLGELQATLLLISSTTSNERNMMAAASCSMMTALENVNVEYFEWSWMTRGEKRA
ncbi:hypothetical protein E2P81_ATG08369 [Venturia nashicola]|uniref:Uncharacterized protein n=1 Tax=Venturia nashicola TaxID=86259 RepID=A0A4Z1P1N4_9PEZI|nr:hypothetical protein E6O75_ATG08559 [Venturia nashicola]TLD21781.1 hypothetical protein E2P81_ATG08369 [Venturia nashicola]